MSYPLLSLLAAAALALVHLFAGRLRFLEGIPRHRWLSFAGGVSVTYVFLHLLPELARGQQAVSEHHGAVLSVTQRHVYVLALLGFAVYYGLERLASESRRQRRQAEGEDRTHGEVFWIHISSFAVYNVIVGYLLSHGTESTPGALALFAVAMALHFLANDFGLHEHHKEGYRRSGRWALAAAVLLGWGLGALWAVRESTIAMLTAFLAGGIVLNVIKEEVPDERRSRFGALALGIALYTVILLQM